MRIHVFVLFLFLLPIQENENWLYLFDSVSVSDNLISKVRIGDIINVNPMVLWLNKLYFIMHFHLWYELQIATLNKLTHMRGSVLCSAFPLYLCVCVSFALCLEMTNSSLAGWIVPYQNYWVNRLIWYRPFIRFYVHFEKSTRLWSLKVIFKWCQQNIPVSTVSNGDF